jgi:membrane protease YdiL (CAAX protease family)
MRWNGTVLTGVTSAEDVDSRFATMDQEPLMKKRSERWLERIQALLEVLLLSGLVSSFFATLPLAAIHHGSFPHVADAGTITAFILLEASITLALMMFVLRMHGEHLRDFGLRRDRWMSHAAVGLALVPVLFLANALIATGFRVFLPKYFLERNPLIDMVRTPRDLVLFICSALYAGGFKEELQRAFILTRFREHLGGIGAGLVIWSLVFGAGHYVQGLQGIVVASVYGMLFGILYVARGSLVAPMVAHAAYDVLALLVYWFTSHLAK